LEVLEDAPAEQLVIPPQSVEEVGQEAARRRFTFAAIVGLCAAAVPYLWILWGGRLFPLRTDFPGNLFSGFYETQAHALFHGHWHVPTGSLGIEAFVVHGRSYMYFGPFPSLLRMPVLLFTSSLDGRLTAPSMLLSWLVTGTFVILLLWKVRFLARGEAPMGRAEAVTYGFLVAGMMSGSVLVYLASAPYVYNEDFCWGVALTLGSLLALLGVLEQPSTRKVIWLGSLLLCVNLSRLTLAWACVIGALLAAAWFATGRGGKDNRRWALPIAIAALLPLAVGCYVTWAKFGYPFGLPMAAQVWSQVDLHRRQFLAANGGKAFNVSFIPTTAFTYLRPDGLRFTDVFPYITLPDMAPGVIGGVVMDMTYRSASAPASMPLLFLLAVWGSVTAFRRKAVGQLALLRIPILAAAAGTVGVFVWGYIANRYLADLLPFLFLAASVGVADLWRRLAGSSSRIRITWGFVIIAAVLFSVVANVAIASTPADVGAWTGSRVQSYVQTQEDLSGLTGNPIAANVIKGTVLPTNSAPADKLFVLGNCEGLFLSNGERYDSWIPVSLGPPLDNQFAVSFSGPVSGRREVPLVAFGRDLVSTVSLEYQGRMMRLTFDDPLFPFESRWMPVTFGKRYLIDVSADIPLHNLAITVNGQSVIPEIAQVMISSGEVQVNPRPDGARRLWNVQPLHISMLRVARPALCTRLLALTPGQGRRASAADVRR
jgi:hypothetical protein